MPVGVRSQAVIVMALTALWYVSLGSEIQHMKERGSDFWYAGLCFFLPIALLFAAILWWSYLRSDRAHSAWVSTATLFALSPLILWLVYCLIYAF